MRDSEINLDPKNLYYDISSGHRYTSFPYTQAKNNCISVTSEVYSKVSKISEMDVQNTALVF